MIEGIEVNANMFVGRRVRDIDWIAKTSGTATYVSDVVLDRPIMEAAILRSPHAHARIRSIDTREAMKRDGVLAVITAFDLPVTKYLHLGEPFSDRLPLAHERVRYIGEPVAVVAAESRELAVEASRLIRVRYRRLRSVLSADKALSRWSPSVHQKNRDNVAFHLHHRSDDLDVAMHDSAFRVRQTYRYGRQAQVPMETNGVVATWDTDDQVLHVWVSTQAPYYVRKELAHVLELAQDQIHIHEVSVGGGFGAKSKIGEHEVLASSLAMRCGLPVRLVYTRDEDFCSTKPRHAASVTLESGAEGDGTLAYRRASIVVDNGAYNQTGPGVMAETVNTIRSLHRLRAVEVDSKLVYTNNQPGGSFRGFGSPQATFAVESQMDELADELNMDPIDFRLLNLNQTGEVTHAGWKISSSAVRDCLTAVRRAIAWDEKRKLGGSGRGVGVAVAIHVTGPHGYAGANRSEARVEVDSEGCATVFIGSADPGTGQRTVLAQVAAEELGLSLTELKVRSMDSGDTPPEHGSWGSRGTYMAGNAVRDASRKVADQLRARAAEKMGVEPTDVRLSGGQATTSVAGQRSSLSIADLVRLEDGITPGVVRADGFFEAASDRIDTSKVSQNVAPTYSFAAHAVEVAVDIETGEIRVVDYVAAHDSGTIVNRTAAEGQVVGGVVMGLGAALREQLIYEGGRVVNPAFINYALPRSADCGDIRTIFIESSDPTSAIGVKGLGEISLTPVAPAIANAVAHAVGVRIRELPITPDKILQASDRDLVGANSSRSILRRPDRWWISLIRWAYPRGLHFVLDRFGPSNRFKHRTLVGALDITRPDTSEKALEVLSGDSATQILGGGTDLIPAIDQGILHPKRLVDLTSIPTLKEIQTSANGSLIVGAAVTLGDLSRFAHAEGDSVIQQTVDQIASAQIREMATVAGNLCQQNRCWFYRNGFDCYKRGGAGRPCYAVLGDHRFYHAIMDAHRCQAITPSDLATTLFALDAVVNVIGRRHRRAINVGDLYRGPGEVALDSDEFVADVEIPAASRARTSHFEKLTLWEGDFAVSSVCVSADLQRDGIVADCRVVLGGLSPVPVRAPEVENELRGRILDDVAIASSLPAWVGRTHPLKGNEWKIQATCGILRRALQSVRRQGGLP